MMTRLKKKRSNQPINFSKSGDTLPPPFNLLPNPRSWCGKIKRIVGSSEQNDKPKFKRSSTKVLDTTYEAMINQYFHRLIDFDLTFSYFIKLLFPLTDFFF